MPRLSAFTPLGLLRMTSKGSDARAIYDQKVASLGGTGLDGRPTAFRIEPGSRVDARCYAEAIREAMARALLRRALAQDVPRTVHHEKIPLREEEYGLAPASDETWIQRRRALEAAALLPKGGDRFTIEDVFRTLLGSGFVYFRTIEPGERVLWPPTIGQSPMLLRGPDQPRVIVRLNRAITIALGEPQIVEYTPVTPLPQGAPVLVGGEQIVVEPEIPVRAERVLVLQVGENDETGAPWIQAIFENAHENGCVATTQPFPLWTSSQRTALVVVSAAVAASAVLVAQIHRVMRSMARVVDTWAIVAATGPHTAGPFQINLSPLGVTPIGLVTFPAYP